MARPLFQLGSFQFDLPNGVPQTMERTAEYRWELQDRLLREPAAQFVGPGSQQIELAGVLYPGFSGRQSTLETLRELAAQGQPQMLTDGAGRVFGRWAIRGLREGRGLFAPGGNARQIDFSVTLVRYGEDNPGQAASPLSMNNASSYAGVASNALAGLSPLTADGSAFKALGWASSPQFSAVAAQAQGAGFSLGQLAGIARSIGDNNYVGAALGAFGMAGLTVNQSDVWTGLGLNTAGILQSMAQGKGAPTMAVLLETLRPATYQTLQQLAGSIGAANGVRNLVRDAATISTLLDVDPHVTAAVRQVVQGAVVLTSSFPVLP
jgi:phage protein U